jgi:hypothetical protein
LKGPELVSVRQFNRRTRADGIAFAQIPSLRAKLLGLRSALAIPRAIESSHLLIMGDSGTGKSALIRQLLVHDGDFPWDSRLFGHTPPQTEAFIRAVGRGRADEG